MKLRLIFSLNFRRRRFDPIDQEIVEQAYCFDILDSLTASPAGFTLKRYSSMRGRKAWKSVHFEADTIHEKLWVESDERQSETGFGQSSRLRGLGASY